jgi:mutator protein MutT
MAKEHHAIIPTSYAVFMKGNEVLLLRRANTGYWDGSYSLPAGHVEAGETFTSGLMREMQEEVDVVPNLEQTEMVHMLHRKSDTDGSQRIDAFFTVREWQGEIQNKEPEKCDELSWYALDKLPANTIPYIKQVLENIQKGVFYSERGW